MSAIGQGVHLLDCCMPMCQCCEAVGPKGLAVSAVGPGAHVVNAIGGQAYVDAVDPAARLLGCGGP